MTLVVLAIGIVILVAAFRNTYAALFAALGTDVPKFVVWAAAIVALGAIGFVPGLKGISRGLLALVIIVIIFQNYANILKGFQSVSSSTSSASNNNSTAPTPAPAATPASQATPNYMSLDYETPPSAYSSASIGH